MIISAWNPCRNWCRIHALLLKKQSLLGLALEPLLGLSAAWGLRHSQSSVMTKQHMLGLELLLHYIHRLPIKLSTSPSPRARDKLLSEGRVSHSLDLKGSEQFLKAQIYILWFWPFFCSFSFLELLPSFMIQAAAHFHLNHSLKHFLCKASGYRWLDRAETAFEFRTRVLSEQIVWGIATFYTTPDIPQSISMQTKIYYSLVIISLFFCLKEIHSSNHSTKGIETYHII